MLTIMFGLSFLAAQGLATKVSATPQNVDFDDLSGAIGLGPGLPVPYRSLNYSGWAIAAASPISTISLRPASLPNYIVGPNPQQLFAPLLISTAGTKTLAFDMTQLSTGCFIATNNGAINNPINCTVRLIGTKAGSGRTVSQSVTFGVDNALGIGLQSKPVQPYKLEGFTQLSKVVLQISKATIPNIVNATVKFGIDDLKQTIYAAR